MATTERKADVVGSGAAIITAYATAELARRMNLPGEVASALIGVLVPAGYKLVKWIGRLVPDAPAVKPRPGPR